MAYRQTRSAEPRDIPYRGLQRLMAEWVPFWVLLGFMVLLTLPVFLRVDPETNATPLLGLAAIFLIPLALLGRFLYRTPTRIALTHDPSERTLRVRTRRMLLFRDEKTLSTEGVREVVVDWGHMMRWYHRSERGPRSEGELAARVVLRYEDGHEEPLTERRLPGTACHDDAAASLREELGLPARPRTFPPPAPPAVSKKWQVAIALGLPLTLLAVGSIIEWAATRGTTPVRIRAETECRIELMRFYPGGESVVRLEAGTHTVQVADPESPTGWRIERLAIEEGDEAEQLFVCR